MQPIFITIKISKAAALNTQSMEICNVLVFFTAMLQRICGYKDSEVQISPFWNDPDAKINRIVSHERILWWAGNNTQMF